MISGKDILLDIIAANKSGLPKGIYSVCTANAEVLEACFKQAVADDSILLVESTSNQVDQFGGYTGMKPADFVGFVKSIAQRTGFPNEKLLLGGDHLGPNPWQNLPVRDAMGKAKMLISEYIKAGYQKIHLDASMFCADDKGDRTKPLPDEVVASRTAELCRVAEDTYFRYRKGEPQPVYVIGTEVPVPGGARENEEELTPTSPEDAANTISVTNKYFNDAGLSDAWGRVIGVVVQPGVEFGDDQIFQYQREKAKKLSKKINDYKQLVYEAHSTDYQTESNLKALVEDHFCILKVGPWLTFAYREALFALESIEVELLGEDDETRSKLRETLDKEMTGNSIYWKRYYPGDEKQKFFKRKYSFSDRSRYYWPTPGLEKVKNRLFENLRKNKIPTSLLSQFMPSQFYQVCDGVITADPLGLLHSYIQNVTGIYARACGLSHKNNGCVNSFAADKIIR